jgi:plasmid maintenance system antidote protein VapI
MAKIKIHARDQLTRYIEDSDRSKTKIAKMLGVSLGQLRHLVAGRRQPSLEIAVRIEDKIGIPARDWV